MNITYALNPVKFKLHFQLNLFQLSKLIAIEYVTIYL
jgi:hypothetical protein